MPPTRPRPDSPTTSLVPHRRRGKVDENGFYFFSSRDDDVIIMAGYRIGPFDVESVLVMHPDVVEAAVVGLPDELRGEVLEAFVVLRDGVEGDDALESDLQQLVKKKFAAHATRARPFRPASSQDSERQGAAVPAAAGPDHLTATVGHGD